MISDTPHLSFEFFPPKTDQGKANLAVTRQKLGKFNPEFFSVTYGAGGSTRATTMDQVAAIQADGFAVAPHISFGGSAEDEVLALLNNYKASGVRHLVALRGDLPSGVGGAAQLVHANQLVAFIRENTGDHFTIHVAAYPEIHPESKSVSSEIAFFKEKVDAGANGAITQYFYSAEAYFRFLEETAKAQITIPIVPGIMPITNLTGLQRFSQICGADLPRWLVKRLEGFDDDEALKDFGAEVVTRLCEQLIQGGAPALHFYTLNQSKPSARILDNLGF